MPYLDIQRMSIFVLSILYLGCDFAMPTVPVDEIPFNSLFEMRCRAGDRQTACPPFNSLFEMRRAIAAPTRGDTKDFQFSI